MSLSDKALLLSVDFSIPSGRKVDKEVSNDIANQHGIGGGRSSSGNFNKITIDPRYLKVPHNIKKNVLFAFENMTLPWVSDGIKMNLLPNKRLFEFSEVWRGCKSEWDQYILNLERGLYDEMMQDGETRLNGKSSEGDGLFSEWDYPPVYSFVSKFRMEYFVRPVPDADNMDLRVSLGNEEADRIKREVKESVKAQFEETQNSLYDRILEAVKHMSRVLSKDKPVIHETLLDKIGDLVDILPELNFAEDEEIDKIRYRIKAELCEDVKTLRESEEVRGGVLHSTYDIIDTMEKIYATRKETSNS